MNKVHVRRDDTVIVISGDDKGAKGKVIAVFKVEGAVYADKVALYCSSCDKGVRSKVKIEDGKKIRVCAKCGKKI